MSALFINAAILIVSAAVFANWQPSTAAHIGDAYKLLTPLLGTAAGSTLFALALLCSGQNATLTGTLAGISSWKASSTSGCGRGCAG